MKTENLADLDMDNADLVLTQWQLTEGVEFARHVEREAIQHGYHVALGGSVLHRGESDKDVDLIVYPHKTSEVRLSPEEFVGKLKDAALFRDFEPRPHGHYGDGKTVFACHTVTGRRVDLIFS
jgi:hypothetical protein